MSGPSPEPHRHRYTDNSCAQPCTCAQTLEQGRHTERASPAVTRWRQTAAAAARPASAYRSGDEPDALDPGGREDTDRDLVGRPMDTAGGPRPKSSSSRSDDSRTQSVSSWPLGKPIRPAKATMRLPPRCLRSTVAWATSGGEGPMRKVAECPRHPHDKARRNWDSQSGEHSEPRATRLLTSPAPPTTASRVRLCGERMSADFFSVALAPGSCDLAALPPRDSAAARRRTPYLVRFP